MVAVALDLAGVAHVPRRAGWEEAAACARVDPGLFYPGQGGTVRPALRVCAACPVRRECLRFAIENGELYGVWGGLSEEQRRRLRRRARQLLRAGEARGG
ncbi:MAG: WhiB family transcriptional regulator [Streptosporangiales bacterium]|nr:WhiB family transcriptional regulator [Streptosporangiales bacterium]